ncbi:hypothetical protein E6Q11_03320 [Candidatus Dojkabacteria bacterium]|uniref:Uncharacterized protein n=1 Tax=Candidatus Dojkabacteria bacterium TaxID=2099670 RepID=A0A5C7J6D6_9BACT|nr:MAG: hypothetical protein E6Q11_03320 [Candidatus Dojkabacteria bacterium]
MNLKNAILQEFQALLFTKDIDVSVKEEGDAVTFAILVGNGVKGGLHFSATVNRFDVNESVQCAMKIFHAQLCLYAIECLKKGVKVKMPKIFIPEFTDTLFWPNVAHAQAHNNDLGSVINSFDVFKGTYFGGSKMPRKVATKKPKAKAKTKK